MQYLHDPILKITAQSKFRFYYRYTEKAVIGDTNLKRMNDNDDINKRSKMLKSGVFNFETDIIWSAVFKVLLLHVIGIYGLLTFNYLENLMTTLWIIGMYFISNIGVSGGVHRYWTHNSYKAKLPLRILFLIFFNAAGQYRISNWVKIHRMHHKYCDTNADPHNSLRGIFYSHVGWLMLKEHPEFTKKSKKFDLSDILSDPIVVFNERHFLLLQVLFCFILPTAIPIYLWNETWYRAIISQMFIRYMLTCNSVWTINSIAHVWGTKPYNKHIRPANNDFINFISIGEGYHNFHHVFPWDYRSSEKGNNRMNYTTFFIDICAKLGQAYDLKYPSEECIKNTVLRKGDGSHPNLSELGSESN